MKDVANQMRQSGKESQANPSKNLPKPYLVKVTADVLNIRKGAGTQYPVVGTIQDRGVYTIVDTCNKWGFLKSKAGWICLDYAKKI